MSRTVSLVLVLTLSLLVPAAALVAQENALTTDVTAGGVAFALSQRSASSLSVSGPDGVFTVVFRAGESPYLGLFDPSGHALVDGSYTWELVLTSRRPIGDDRAEDRGLVARPDTAQSFSGYLTVLNGAFVSSTTETTAPESSEYTSQENGSRVPTRDQVILDDLIVDGSACVGQDCVNGESFGFDTLRLKENNLRIKFQDTSNSASFPTNDWQLTANATTNGGANKFSIDDIDGGRTPFTIEASAPSNSLYVDDGGRVGLGTATPVVELHVVNGDSPTLRLEQNGSSGFTPQTWDVAGNEAGFFVRDATNGSTLPFRILPGAASQSLVIDGDNQIGINSGTNPDADLHITGTATTAAHTMIHLDSAKIPRIEFENSTTGRKWFFAGGTTFQIASEVGGTPLSLATDGTLTLQGGLVTGTPAGTCNPGPCDATFTDYAVESIEDHAAYMWENSHLWGVGPTVEGTPMNVTKKTAGILHELEKAHIYIEQLNGTIKDLQARLAALEAASE